MKDFTISEWERLFDILTQNPEATKGLITENCKYNIEKKIHQQKVKVGEYCWLQRTLFTKYQQRDQ